MMKKANKTIIGAFVVGAMALLIIAVIVFGSGQLFKQADKYILFFDGSVKGLSVGAPVIFRGVKIGAVKDISLIYYPEIRDVLIAATIEVELSRVQGAPEKLGYPDYKYLIERGLRARLEIQNIVTGQLMISFNFFPGKEVKMYGVIKAYPELPTIPTSPDIFEIMDQIPIKEISDGLQQAVAGVNKLINSGGIDRLNTALQEIIQASRSFRLFVEYLEQHPEALLKGKPISKGE